MTDSDIKRLLYHSKWIDEIGYYINKTDDVDIIKFALGYTLQSLRANEDIHRFRWSS